MLFCFVFSCFSFFLNFLSLFCCCCLSSCVCFPQTFSLSHTHTHTHTHRHADHCSVWTHAVAHAERVADHPAVRVQGAGLARDRHQRRQHPAVSHCLSFSTTSSSTSSITMQHMPQDLQRETADERQRLLDVRPAAWVKAASVGPFHAEAGSTGAAAATG